MARTAMFSRPNMTAMPPDIGRLVFEAIRNTPPIDYAKMHEEAMEWERNAMSMREKRKNENN